MDLSVGLVCFVCPSNAQVTKKREGIDGVMNARLNVGRRANSSDGFIAAYSRNI